MDAVRTSVNPKVIDCPDPSKGTTMLDAVAKDGIRLLVKARVTVRTNLDRLVGGATEDTIIARVGQGIVSAIGSQPTYKNVLENPDHISRKVLDSGLDSQTAFEIVSIDIADVSVAGVSGGREVANVGALLETERAEADKKMRQAEAEGRRAMAVATEQEMRARVQEMQAKVIEAQAEVPLAIAQAFNSRQASASWTSTACRTSWPTPRCASRWPRATYGPQTRTFTSVRKTIGSTDGSGTVPRTRNQTD
jgi:uncharacterized protein YqfA (UPF0365 family)